jgi:hypothetical protein
MMFRVAQRNDGGVRLPPDCLPEALAIAQEAQVVHPFGVILRLVVDERVSRPKGPISVPNGIDKLAAPIVPRKSDIKDIPWAYSSCDELLTG